MSWVENIAHCSNKAELVDLTTAWEFPYYVDYNTHLKFEFLKKEVDLKQSNTQ